MAKRGEGGYCAYRRGKKRCQRRGVRLGEDACGWENRRSGMERQGEDDDGGELREEVEKYSESRRTTTKKREKVTMTTA